MKKHNRPESFPVAAIGASAGGLTAFEELLAALPPKPGIAFVLVPHLAPQYKSHLAEILARSARLPIGEVKNGDRVLPDRIYVLPPGRKILIKKGTLRLSRFGDEAERHNPIDAFFRSVAGDRKKKAIGILLSGEGSDGTAGLRAIKENGGITFAQSRSTAAHISMPDSAALAGYADFVLSPAGIGKKLGFARRGGVISRDGSPVKSGPGDGDSLNRILELLRTAKGVDFGLYKRSTLRRRVQRRVMLGGGDPEKYFAALRTDPEELDSLYHDMLISVTSFFREPESFKVLKNAVYPRILKNNPFHAPVRIWVPGCSTGEEAYSHAINLVEFLGRRFSHIPFQIFATDVNPAVIETARAGFYSRKIRSEISRARLRRFFVETKDGYRVVPAIRERCVFAVQNLVQDPPFINLDLISCRNLLIYLGPELQEKALRIFQYSLKPRGILMLGSSEAIGDFAGRFTPLDVKRKVFFEGASSSRAPLGLAQTERSPEIKTPGRYEPGQSAGNAPEACALQCGLDNVLPARYLPNGVIVNGELEILRFLGNISPYLRPAPGKPGMNLRRMASGPLLMELRAAIHMSKKSACAVRREVPAPHPGGGRVRIEVLPVKAGNLHKEYFLILFEEAAAAEPGKPPAERARRPGESRRVMELKEDLAVSGEHLKSIIEEQESTNARLQASNEELRSSNEELQSLNEEFETAKEELQSANEELLTSAEEVGRNNQILNRANDDFTNLLASIDIPIVLLGPDLTVRRFTQPAEKILGLSPEKIGRPLAAIRLPLRLSGLEQSLLAVIRTGSMRAAEVRDKRGRWYNLIIQPYRTAKSGAERSRIEGAVLALIDIHDRKRWEKTVLRLATVVRDSNDAVIIRDLKGRIVSWNSGAQKIYGYTDAEVLETGFARLIPKDERERTRELMRLSSRGNSAPQAETRRLTKDGRILDVLLTVTVLRNNYGKPVEIATTERDITEQKRTERELRRLNARVISAQETERRRLARDLHDGVGQILSGVKFRLEALPGELALGGGAAAKFFEASGALNRAISEIRRVSQNLMPSELMDLGLEPALRTLCREFKERSGINVELRTGPVPPAAAPGLELALFRIAQEALNNCGKHSKATRIIVGLSRKKGELVLSVRDNGIGFAMGGKRQPSGRGIGLGNMRARAESVGGRLRIESRPGAGTRLRVHAPISGPKGGIA